jgi:hypothetical protein
MNFLVTTSTGNISVEVGYISAMTVVIVKLSGNFEGQGFVQMDW